MTETFEDCGIHFRYPDDWELDVTEEGAVTTIALHSTTGPAFALVTLDENRHDPSEIVNQALEVLQEEYPGLDSTPAREMIGGYKAMGHDVEFFSLDMMSTCAIRCFRTHRRTVLLFGQWSDLEGEETGEVLADLRRSFEETDAEEV
ncbi:MAG: hypothetical protein AB7I30_17390 [Isosphaeraceae bacterium]